VPDSSSVTLLESTVGIRGHNVALLVLDQFPPLATGPPKLNAVAVTICCVPYALRRWTAPVSGKYKLFPVRSSHANLWLAVIPRGELMGIDISRKMVEEVRRRQELDYIKKGISDTGYNVLIRLCAFSSLPILRRWKDFLPPSGSCLTCINFSVGRNSLTSKA